MSTGKILLGVLAGVATGAILGILFAPDKGSETRKKISRKCGDTMDACKEKFTDFVSNISGKYEKVAADLSDAAEEAMKK